MQNDNRQVGELYRQKSKNVNFLGERKEMTFYINDRIVILLFIIIVTFLVLIFKKIKKIEEYQGLIYSRLSLLTSDRIIDAIKEALKRAKDEEN